MGHYRPANTVMPCQLDRQVELLEGARALEGTAIQV